MKYRSQATPRGRACGAAVVILLLSGCKAHSTGKASEPAWSPPVVQPEATDDDTPTAGLGPVAKSRVPAYNRSLSLVIGTESYQVLYRQNSELLDGYWNLEFLSNEDEDLVLNTHLQRMGLLPGTPVSLGVGIGAYGVAFEQSEKEVFALTLSGTARYDLPSALPMALNFGISYAPEITTFADGVDLLDISLRLEAQISANAVAFVGGRWFDSETAFDEEVTRDVLVGVRLGY